MRRLSSCWTERSIGVEVRSRFQWRIFSHRASAALQRLRAERLPFVPGGLGHLHVHGARRRVGEITRAGFDQLLQDCLNRSILPSVHSLCSMVGLQLHGILLEDRTGSDDPNYNTNGNVFLDFLHGATVEKHPGNGLDMNAEIEVVAEKFRAEGRKVYGSGIRSKEPSWTLSAVARRSLPVRWNKKEAKRVSFRSEGGADFQRNRGRGFCGDVAIRAGWIAEIAPHIPPQGTAEVIDVTGLTGLTVAPGLSLCTPIPILP